MLPRGVSTERSSRTHGVHTSACDHAVTDRKCRPAGSTLIYTRSMRTRCAPATTGGGLCVAPQGRHCSWLTMPTVDMRAPALAMCRT